MSAVYSVERGMPKTVMTGPLEPTTPGQSANGISSELLIPPMVRQTAQCHTAAMATGDLQGWYSDPFGQHDKRYFSAGRPTKLVRDGDIDGFSEPPAENWIPTHDMVAESQPGVGTGPDPTPGRTMQLGGIVFAPASGHAIGRQSAGKVRRSRGWRNAAVVVLATLVAMAIVLFVRRGSGPAARPSVTTVAFITQAAQRTLAERSAYMTLSGTIQIGSQWASITGSGEANFSGNAATFSFTGGTNGTSVTEKEIMVGGDLYLTETVNGTSFSQITGGPEWIRIPAKQSATANVSGFDPRMSLSALEQQGNSVRSLGTEFIGGVTCSGYAVTINPKAMIAALQKEHAASGLPAGTADSDKKLVQGMSPLTLTVWLDANRFIRQMSLNVQMNELGTSDSASIVIDLSRLGAPVHITAPAQPDTISYKALVQDAAKHGSNF